MKDSTKSRKWLTVEVGDLKEPWERYCNLNAGETSSEVLRQVIRKLAHREIAKVGAESGCAPEPVVQYQVKEAAEKRLERGMEIRFTESERQAVRERAKAEGFPTANQWVTALVRANLTSTPQFGKVEIQTLGESNHQLLAIGRNLNQLAKAMNSVKTDGEKYDRELVEELAKAVRTHVRKVGDALRASIYRWQLIKANATTKVKP